MNEAPIYLDFAATTPIDPAVAARMQAVQQSAYFNPSSNHIAGRASAAVVAHAALQLGQLLRIPAANIIWTSGATESNNLAILGATAQREHKGKHLITMRTEHKAVVDVFRALEKRGFEVSWLDPDVDGQLSLQRLLAAIRADTQLVSVMHVNNETGAIQNIAEIGEVCRSNDILFHVDGAQAAGKIRVDLASLPVDLYSVTAHKFYGPKGIGALYVATGTVLQPQLFGGGQQRRLRPGTLAVDLIAGLGAAAAIADASIERDLATLATLKAQLFEGISDVGGLQSNSPADGGYPGILNVRVADTEGESLLLAMEPLCVATGSACNSQSQEPSYVLRAMGLSDRQAQSSVRFSFGRSTTGSDIASAIALYRAAVRKLRVLAPTARSES